MPGWFSPSTRIIDTAAARIPHFEPRSPPPPMTRDVDDVARQPMTRSMSRRRAVRAHAPSPRPILDLSAPHDHLPAADPTAACAASLEHHMRAARCGLRHAPAVCRPAILASTMLRVSLFSASGLAQPGCGRVGSLRRERSTRGAARSPSAVQPAPRDLCAGLVQDRRRASDDASRKSLLLGTVVVDREFGTTIRRITAVTPSANPAIKPLYTTIAAWNADELYDVAGGNPPAPRRQDHQSSATSTSLRRGHQVYRHMSLILRPLLRR